MSAESFFDAHEKLMTINLLRMAMKHFDTLEKFRGFFLKNGLELSIANLSRYVNGKALPKSKLKEQILKILIDNRELNLTIDYMISSHIEVISDEKGTVVNNTYLLNDSENLAAILFLAIRKEIINRNVNKIFTVEVDGIPVGMTLSRLMNLDCVYARRKKPAGSTIFSLILEEDISSHSAGRIDTIYLPEKFIEKGENVLVVDDVIRTGATQEAFINLVHRAGRNPVQCLILVGIGEKWAKITELNGVPFTVLKVVK